ncbi:hypothetical protein A3752_06290 [Oleiphilus sp. HI0081]|jgi:hypothetical protein|nr:MULTISPECIES: DUF642 domain-containing protein [unclassified Oleiphilus]KZY46019.1 hypothetical protein A3732_08395 [Oleiphilus sp. HI0050]KZY75261.1 hypothetical protein A3740_15575 [Oleiphilus sp. HI0068]KZY81288.1 hypothetical protein A3741_04600 [Oleiphilus sp. HI0069]KZY85435.1 hypothetical protein A3743_19110 [Oleiphilus sp. HI0072]KZZ22483.1 hypothetical protein A3752_06290 [Oleiphilus sp. HI0081]KZZ34772.1 hypothetical protein A3756_17240 [Oleiphilus sp. HI0086]
MKNLTKLFGSICLTTAVSMSAQANLIENGSFEDIGNEAALGGYGSAATWQIYSSIPNWDASQNVEIWSNNFIVPADDGIRVLELNAHPGDANGQFSIFQDFATTAGQAYELSFAGRRRQANSDEAFSVSVGDLSDSVYNQSWGNWNQYTYQFTATSSLSTLTFTSLDGGRDTTGNIFDDVKVTAVSEPGTIALFALGLAGLVATRKKMK